MTDEIKERKKERQKESIKEINRNNIVFGNGIRQNLGY
jgi:hypothetical protein